MLAHLAIAVLAAMAFGAPAAQAADQVSVGVSPTEESADVGSEFKVRATITNDGAAGTQPLTAHLEIIDPTRAGSVDAEDWVPDLNTTIGPIPPGASRDVTWSLKPISGGRFAVYVVAIPEAAGSTPSEAVVASQAIPVDVREVRTLDPGGALSVSLIVPLLLAGGLIAVRVAPRRRARRAERGAAA